jgi:hypothetical protein
MTRNEIIVTIFAGLALGFLFVEAYVIGAEHVIKHLLG